MPTATIFVSPADFASGLPASFVIDTSSTVGSPTCSPSATVSGGIATVTNRGYLRTLNHFDPASMSGGIVVSGTWTIKNTGDTMQILTRSDGFPRSDNYGETNYGVEFACSQGGGCAIYLRVASSTTASTLASGGSGIAVNTAYNFQVIDTGTYVMFAIGTGSTWSITLNAMTTTRNCANKVVFHNRECGYGSPGGQISAITIAQLSPLGRTVDQVPGTVVCSVSVSPSPSTYLYPSMPTSTVLVSTAQQSTTFGYVAVSANGCTTSATLSSGIVTVTSRGYWVSNSAYDPVALGGIMITGTWTFQTSGDTMQIATRANGLGAGQYGETDLGLEFWCQQGVNCMINTRGGGGGYSTLVTGSVTLNTNTAYNFQIIDTGTYVLFAIGTGSTWSMILTTSSPTRFSCNNKITFHNRECAFGSPGSKIGSITVSQLAALPRALDISPGAFPCTQSVSLSSSNTPSVTPTISNSPSMPPSVSPTISQTASVTPTISITASITPTITPSQYLSVGLPTTTVLIRPSTLASFFVPNLSSTYQNGQSCSPAVSVSSGVVTITSRGYYQTINDFDPAVLGPIVITGTFTFQSSQDVMQVLTRSNGVPISSNYGETDYGVEFECVMGSCNIGLRTGNSAETTYTSVGASFSTGTAYNFQIVDTGTYVLFAVGTGSSWPYVLNAMTTSRSCLNKIVFHNRECQYGSPGAVFGGITVALLAALPRALDQVPASLPCPVSPTPTISITSSLSTTSTATVSQTPSSSPTISVTASVTASRSPTISITASPSPSHFLYPGLPTTTVLVSPSTLATLFVPNLSSTYQNGQTCSPGVSVSNGVVSLTSRGYYQTTNDFDPALLGGIVITGTWTFQTTADTMQVLTRSDGVPALSNYGETDYGVEFECLMSGSCNIGLRTGNGAVTLLISVAASFSTGTAYNFQIIDTGTYVLLAVGTGSTWTYVLNAMTTARYCQNKIVFHNRECQYGSPPALVGGITVALLGALPRPLDQSPAPIPCSPSTSPTSSVTVSPSPSSSASSSSSASTTPTISLTASVTPSRTPTVSNTASVTPSQYLHINMPTTTVIASPSTLASIFENNLSASGYQSGQTCSPAVSVSSGVVTITSRGYYQTSHDYDPVLVGGIVITGSWTWGSASDSVQILTRSNGVPANGFYAETDYGVEFECLMSGGCLISLRTGGGAQTILSQTSASFSTGTSYNFQVVDTGVNLFFAWGTGGSWTSLTASSTQRNCVNKIVFHNRECQFGSPSISLTGITVALLGQLSRPLDVSPGAIPCSYSPTPSPTISISASVSPSHYLYPDFPTTTILVAPSSFTSSLPATFTKDTSSTYGGCTPTVTISGGVVTLTSRGYLESSADYDPAVLQPGILVSGTWTFGSSSDVFQILTRSNGVPISGNYGETDYGLEFECTAGSGCNIATRNGGGVYTTLVSNTGGPFNSGTAYKFQVIDTGTYVLFALGTGSTWSTVLTTSTPVRYCVNKVVFHNRECSFGSPGLQLSGITIAQLASSFPRAIDMTPNALPCSPSLSVTASLTPTISLTASTTPPPSQTSSNTASTSQPPSVSQTQSPSQPPTPSATASGSAAASVSSTSSLSQPPTSSATPSHSQPSSATQTPSSSATPSQSQPASVTSTPSPSQPSSVTQTPTRSSTASPSQPATATSTPSPSQPSSVTQTPTRSSTASVSQPATSTSTPSPSQPSSVTQTPTRSYTASPSQPATATSTPSPSQPSSATETPTPSSSQPASSSETPSPSQPPSASVTAAPSSSSVLSRSASETASVSPTPSFIYGVTVRASTQQCVAGNAVTISATLVDGIALSTPVTVTLSYAGTARPNVDFTATGHVITIPAGSLSGQVVLYASRPLLSVSTVSVYILFASFGKLVGPTFTSITLLPASPDLSPSAPSTPSSTPSATAAPSSSQPPSVSTPPSASKTSSSSRAASTSPSSSRSPSRSVTGARSVTRSNTPTNTPTVGLVTVTCDVCGNVVRPGQTATLTMTLTTAVLDVPVTIHLNPNGNAVLNADYVLASSIIVIPPFSTTAIATVSVPSGVTRASSVAFYVTLVEHASLDPSSKAFFRVSISPEAM